MLSITTNLAEMDVDAIHRFLAEESAWARGIPRATFDLAIANSLCFAGTLGREWVAFARVVSDYATFANLLDVCVVPSHRGKGYGKAIVAAVMEHPRLQGLRRFTLATANAHGLYAPFGFTAPLKPQTLMERYQPNIYAAA